MEFNSLACTTTERAEGRRIYKNSISTSVCGCDKYGERERGGKEHDDRDSERMLFSPAKMNCGKECSLSLKLDFLCSLFMFMAVTLVCISYFWPKLWLFHRFKLTLAFFMVSNVLHHVSMHLGRGVKRREEV